MITLFKGIYFRITGNKIIYNSHMLPKKFFLKDLSYCDKARKCHEITPYNFVLTRLLWVKSVKSRDVEDIIWKYI
jgi:hypothetical protein